MPGRVFLFLLIILIPLVILTSPPLMRHLLAEPNAYPWAESTPASAPPPTTPPDLSGTLDLFAAVPIATFFGRGLNALLTSMTTLSFEPTCSLTGLLPDSLATPRLITDHKAIHLPRVPTSAGAPTGWIDR